MIQWFSEKLSIALSELFGFLNFDAHFIWENYFGIGRFLPRSELHLTSQSGGKVIIPFDSNYLEQPFRSR